MAIGKPDRSDLTFADLKPKRANDYVLLSGCAPFRVRDEPQAEIVRAMRDGNHLWPRATGAQLIVVQYKIPDKTKGGIILTAKTQREGVWQGRAACVVAIGPECWWTVEGMQAFKGPYCQLGDWVLFPTFENSATRWETKDQLVSFVALDCNRIIAVVDDPADVL